MSEKLADEQKKLKNNIALDAAEAGKLEPSTFAITERDENEFRIRLGVAQRPAEALPTACETRTDPVVLTPAAGDQVIIGSAIVLTTVDERGRPTSAPVLRRPKEGRELTVELPDLRLERQPHGPLRRHDDRPGEADAVLEHAGGAEAVDHRLHREAHGEHPVGEHARQADGGRDVVAVVDRPRLAVVLLRLVEVGPHLGQHGFGEEVHVDVSQPGQPERAPVCGDVGVGARCREQRRR